MRSQRIYQSPIFAIMIIAFALTMPLHASAWGVVGHRYINNLAIDCLPDSLKPFYAANRDWIRQHSTDPDDWRKGSRTEAPHHFIDLDIRGMDVALNFPQEYWEATGMYGKAEIDKNGVVPWRIGQYYGKLVRAFKDKDAKRIIETSAWLGHYAADIHVPFHATANYDGQLTGQKGIHARFESIMVEKQIKATELKSHNARLLKDPVASAFLWAKDSLKLCPAILSADTAAVSKDPNYGDEYYKSLGLSARLIAVRRLEEGASDLASLWLSAWTAAGRPELPAAADVHAGEPLDKPTHDPDVIRE